MTSETDEVKRSAPEKIISPNAAPSKELTGLHGEKVMSVWRVY